MATTVQTDQELLGQQLRRARSQAGLTQAVAAVALGVSPAALSQYEAGRRGVDAITLERLARLYNLPLRFFFGEETVRADWEDALLTGTANLSPEARSGVSRLTDAVHDLTLLYAKTESTPPLVPHPPFHALPNTNASRQDGALWAEKTRRHFDLGIAPLPDLRGFLEVHGFRLFAVPLGRHEESVSGLSFHHPDLGPILALNADQAYALRSFAIAHQFAHVLFHYDQELALCRPGDHHPREQFANGFASHFLIPPEALREFLRQHQWRQVTSAEQIVQLAHYFAVSYSVMRDRLRAEGLLATGVDAVGVHSVALARSLGYQPSRFECGDLPLPPEERLPRVFLGLAREAVQHQRLSMQRVAEMLGISEYELEDRLFPQGVEAVAEAYA